MVYGTLPNLGSVETQMTRRAIDAVTRELDERLSASVERTELLAEGMNRVYRVVTEEQDFVAKIGVHDTVSVRAEPFIIDRLRAETKLPLPTVVHSAPVDNPPWFLMRYIEHDRVHDHAHAMELDTVIDLAALLGQTLARMQRISIDGVGQMTFVAETRTVRPRVAQACGDSAESVSDSFVTAYRRILNRFNVQARHNYPRLALDPAFIEDLSVPVPVVPTMCPLDLHIRNLLFDAGELRAVIDHERVYAGHAGWGLENTLYMLTVTREPPERARIDRAFTDGYAQVDAVPDRHDVFELGAILREMRAAHIWWSDPDQHRDRIKNRLEDVVDRLG